MNRADVIKRWNGRKAALESFPARFGTFADEDHAGIVARLCEEDTIVCEVGCGIGRMATVFHHERYIGVDINETAIVMARLENPEHDFRFIRWGGVYPDADVYLLHTLLMHVPDEDLQSVLVRARPKLVIFEAMEPAYSKPGRGNWHRSKDDYEYALARAAFDVTRFEEHETRYQPNVEMPELMRRFIVAESIE